MPQRKQAQFTSREPFFSSNVHSYALTQNHTTDGLPIAVKVLRIPNPAGVLEEGILTFLSPLEALFEAQADDPEQAWDIRPFDQVDPTHFITTQYPAIKRTTANHSGITSILRPNT